MEVDGEKYKIDTDTLMMEGIKEGKDIPFERFVEINHLSNCNRAYEKALYLLDYRDRTYLEIKRKLMESYPPEAVEYALEKVQELGLIDDENFARRFAGEMINFKNYGKNRVESELYRRGVERDIIEKVLEEFDVDSVEKIREIIRRKYSPIPEDKKELSKIVNALMRQGYSYGDIKNALKLTED